LIKALAQEWERLEIVRDRAIIGNFAKVVAPHKKTGFGLFQALLGAVVTILLDILEKGESVVKKRFLR